METHELLMTALRGVGVYVLMLVVVRIAGKRTIGNFTAFDLLVALMLGEVVDEIIYGDVTFLQGTIAIVVVALLHYGNSWLSYYGHGLDTVLEGTPTVVVRNGILEQKGMRSERLNDRDVLSLLRQQGVTDIREVRLAIMENDGQLSVLEHDWAQPVRKADVDEAAGKQQRKDAGDEETPREKRTDRDIEGGT